MHGMSKMKKILRLFFNKEFILFLFIGIINTFSGVLFATIYSLIFNANIAFCLGYISGLTISYILNSVINFKQKLAFIKFLKFSVSYVPNFIIQNIVVFIFYNILHFAETIVYIFAAIIGIPITFLFIKLFAFKKNN